MPSLKVLRRRKRKKQRKKARAKAAVKRIKRRIGKLNKAIRRQVKRQVVKRRKRAWGGSKWIVAREVRPVVRRHGIARTSGKRRETFGNPSSDHFIGNRSAYAEDYATANNQKLAQEIRSSLGGGRHRDYESFHIVRRHTGGARTYRVQIIASTHGTGPHLHVGIRRT